MRLPPKRKPKSKYAAMIGRNIAWHRFKQGMSQKDLAELCGMSNGGLCDLENGYRRVLAENLHRIAEALGASMDSFFTEPQWSDDDV